MPCVTFYTPEGRGGSWEVAREAVMELLAAPDDAAR